MMQCGTTCNGRDFEEDETPAHNNKDVGIVEEDEEDEIEETSSNSNPDDGVDVEDDPADGDNIRRPKILLKEEGGHVDNKVEGVETNHIVSDRGTGVANRPGNAEDVDVGHVDPPRQILHQLAYSRWWLSYL